MKIKFMNIFLQFCRSVYNSGEARGAKQASDRDFSDNFFTEKNSRKVPSSRSEPQMESKFFWLFCPK